MPLNILNSTAQEKKVFKIVPSGSTSLTPTQQKYSTIELECLAIKWAIQKCPFYLRGLPLFSIFTNHCPLEAFFQEDIFDLASPRLQRMREKVAMYSFIVTWVLGKTHLIADGLVMCTFVFFKRLVGSGGRHSHYMPHQYLSSLY